MDPLFAHLDILPEQYFECTSSPSLSSSDDSVASPIDSPSGDLYHSMFCDGSEFTLEMACDDFLPLANSCSFPNDLTPNEAQLHFTDTKRDNEMANRLSRPRRFPRRARFCYSRAAVRRQRSPDARKENFGSAAHFPTERTLTDSDLETENRKLRERLRAVEKENDNLREEVAFLKSTLKHPRDTSTVTWCNLPNSKPTEEGVVSAGLLLMVMWITCVLISHVTPPHAGAKRIGFDASLPILSQADHHPTRASLPFEPCVNDNTAENPQHQSRSVDSSQLINDISSDDVDYASAKTGAKRKRSQTTFKTVEKNTRRKTSPVEQLPSGEFKPNSPLFKVPLIEEWKSNTTYLMCPTVLQMTPPSGARIVNPDDSSPLISFFIPPDMIPNGSENSNTKVLQVTCQVVDMNLLPV